MGPRTIAFAFGWGNPKDPRPAILSPEEMKVFVDTFTRSGFTGGINW